MEAFMTNNIMSVTGHVNKQARIIINNVRLFLTKLKDDPQQLELLNIQKPRHLTAMICGVSTSTVDRIKQECKDYGEPRIPRQHVNQKRPVTNIDDFDKCIIKQIVTSFCAQRKHLTVQKILDAVKERIDGFKCSNTSMRSILKDLGYKFITPAGRRQLFLRKNAKHRRILDPEQDNGESYSVLQDDLILKENQEQEDQITRETQELQQLYESNVRENARLQNQSQLLQKVVQPFQQEHQVMNVKNQCISDPEQDNEEPYNVLQNNQTLKQKQEQEDQIIIRETQELRQLYENRVHQNARAHTQSQVLQKVVQPFQQQKVMDLLLNKVQKQPFGPASNTKTTPRGVQKKPRRPMTAYDFFKQISRDDKKQRIEEKTHFKNWNAMSITDRQKYHEMEIQDKQRYELEMQSYLPSAPEKSSCRRKRPANKDPLAPRKPLSPFLWYWQDMRAQVQLNNPGYTMVDISKELGRLWGEDPEIRSKYEWVAEQDRARYGREMREYKIALEQELDQTEAREYVQSEMKEDINCMSIEIKEE